MLFCSSCLVIGSATCGRQLRGDDWPQWRGPTRDGVWKETGLVEKFSAPRLPLRWRAAIGSGYSGPTVADGRVYVTDLQTDPRPRKGSTASIGRRATACGTSPTTAPTRTSGTRRGRGPASPSTMAVLMPWGRWGICTVSTPPRENCSGRSSRAWTTRSARRSGALPRRRWSMASW